MNDAADRAVRSLLDEAVSMSAAADAELPSCFIAADPEGGGVIVVGPYPDAHTALLAGEAHRVYQLGAMGEPALVIRVAPMLTPGD